VITGDTRVLDDTVDFSVMGIAFSTKPTVMGGLAMEYYGLRKRGADIDMLISNEDYLAFAQAFPQSKIDRWGDLGLSIGPYELFRSVFRLDCGFYSQGAFEHTKCKVLSFEKLLFMKTLAAWNQPEIPKHVEDLKLVMEYYLCKYQNMTYVENAAKHTASYLAAQDGTIYNDMYFTCGIANPKALFRRISDPKAK